jgi:release factor glutamine methyltransferase
MTPAVAAAAGPTVTATLRDVSARLAAVALPTARQDAELLLARALGTTRLGLYTAPLTMVPDPARAALEPLVARRERHEPLQHILGETEFCGIQLELGPGVFVPRPETEALVERALALGPPGPATVLELCTGSGAIACALAMRRADWAVWAVDRDSAAVDCAQANVRRLGLEGRVQVRAGDLFAPLRGRVAAGAADLVVANPPYLATALLPTLPAEVREWEPPGALDGGVDGLDVIRRLLAEAAEWLGPVGAGLLVEIGEEQGPGVRALVAADGRYGEARVHRDFRGCERVLEARRR